MEMRLGFNRIPTGSEERNENTYFELTIVLSDGCRIRVATRALRLELHEQQL
jgi:hypothetical protein